MAQKRSAHYSHKLTPLYLLRTLSIVVGLVLVWRGIWYVIDALDLLFFGGTHIWSAIGGVIVGLLILYLPDGDLKEIEKL